MNKNDMKNVCVQCGETKECIKSWSWWRMPYRYFRLFHILLPDKVLFWTRNRADDTWICEDCVYDLTH